jgi:hypothetical protein
MKGNVRKQDSAYVTGKEAFVYRCVAGSNS